jgi:hypothetical protein
MQDLTALTDAIDAALAARDPFACREVMKKAKAYGRLDIVPREVKNLANGGRTRRPEQPPLQADIELSVKQRVDAHNAKSPSRDSQTTLAVARAVYRRGAAAASGNRSTGGFARLNAFFRLLDMTGPDSLTAGAFATDRDLLPSSHPLAAERAPISASPVVAAVDVRRIQLGLSALVADIITDSMGRRWDPRLHPRGRDGRFINVGGIVKFFEGNRSPNVRGTGTVERILPNGEVLLRVHSDMKDGSLKDKLVTLKPKQIAQLRRGEVRLDLVPGKNQEALLPGRAEAVPANQALPDRFGKVTKIGDSVRLPDGSTGRIVSIDHGSGRFNVRDDHAGRNRLVAAENAVNLDAGAAMHPTPEGALDPKEFLDTQGRGRNRWGRNRRMVIGREQVRRAQARAALPTEQQLPEGRPELHNVMVNKVRDFPNRPNPNDRVQLGNGYEAVFGNDRVWHVHDPEGNPVPAADFGTPFGDNGRPRRDLPQMATRLGDNIIANEQARGVRGENGKYIDAAAAQAAIDNAGGQAVPEAHIPDNLPPTSGENLDKPPVNPPRPPGQPDNVWRQDRGPKPPVARIEPTGGPLGGYRAAQVDRLGNSVPAGFTRAEHKDWNVAGQPVQAWEDANGNLVGVSQSNRGRAIYYVRNADGRRGLTVSSWQSAQAQVAHINDNPNIMNPPMEPPGPGAQLRAGVLALERAAGLDANGNIPPTRWSRVETDPMAHPGNQGAHVNDHFVWNGYEVHPQRSGSYVVLPQRRDVPPVQGELNSWSAVDAAVNAHHDNVEKQAREQMGQQLTALGFNADTVARAVAEPNAGNAKNLLRNDPAYVALNRAYVNAQGADLMNPQQRADFQRFNQVDDSINKIQDLSNAGAPDPLHAAPPVDMNPRDLRAEFAANPETPVHLPATDAHAINDVFSNASGDRISMRTDAGYVVHGQVRNDGSGMVDINVVAPNGELVHAFATDGGFDASTRISAAIETHMAANAPAPVPNAPAPAPRAADLASLRDALPRTMREAGGNVHVRNARFALDDAIMYEQNGDNQLRDRALNRAAFLLHRGGRVEDANQVNRVIGDGSRDLPSAPAAAPAVSAPPAQAGPSRRVSEIQGIIDSLPANVPQGQARQEVISRFHAQTALNEAKAAEAAGNIPERNRRLEEAENRLHDAGGQQDLADARQIRNVRLGLVPNATNDRTENVMPQVPAGNGPQEPAAPAAPPAPAVPQGPQVRDRFGRSFGVGDTVYTYHDRMNGTVTQLYPNGYVRIRFQNGNVVVRSSGRVRAAHQDPNAPQAPAAPNAPVNAPAAPSYVSPTALEAKAPSHPNAYMPNATAADYESWGDRAPAIAAAARARPSWQAIHDAYDRGDTQAANDMVMAGMGHNQKFGRKGFVVKWATPYRDFNGTISMNGKIYDARGNHVGSTQRQLRNDNGTWSVYNALLQFNGDAGKKSGFASDYAHYLENWYIANGVSHVDVSAALSNGGFVWAHTGFDWHPQQSKRGVSGLLDKVKSRAGRDAFALDQVNKLEQQLANAGDNRSEWPSPQDLALVGWQPGKESWAGQALNGSSWSGRKYLDPNARTYLQRREFDFAKQEQRLPRPLSELQDPSSRPWNTPKTPYPPITQELFGKTPPLAVNDQHLAEINAVLGSGKPLKSLSNGGFDAMQRHVRSSMLNPDIVGNSTKAAQLDQLDALVKQEELRRFPPKDIGDAGRALLAKSYQGMIRNSADWHVVNLADTGERGAIGKTHRVTHVPTGQVFYVKWVSQEHQQSSEKDAVNAAHALGILGAPTVIRHQDPNVIIMTSAGDGQPVDPGSITRGDRMRPNRFDNLSLDDLANPNDLFAWALHDILIGNHDRHGGNYMVGKDGAGKYRYFPIDHGLSLRSQGLDQPNSVAHGIAQGQTGSRIGVGISRRPSQRLLQAYRNRVGNDRYQQLWHDKIEEFTKKLEDPNITWENQGNLTDMLAILNGIKTDEAAWINTFTGQQGGGW